jgi:hypothetical protein
VGCGLATYFWSWPKNTKRKVSRQEERKGREGKGPAEEAKTWLGPEGHRSKQQSESKGGRIIRWTSTNINEPVSDAGPPVVSMRIGVPKRPRKDGVVGEPRAQRGMRTILRGSLVKAVP